MNLLLDALCSLRLHAKNKKPSSLREMTDTDAFLGRVYVYLVLRFLTRKNVMEILVRLQAVRYYFYCVAWCLMLARLRAGRSRCCSFDVFK